MKTIFILSFLTFTALPISAQTLENYSIDSGGASTTVGAIQILYTIGETNVQELSFDGISVSEGFINSSEFATLSQTETELDTSILSLYPNPVKNNIHIVTNLKITSVVFFDLLGKQVLTLKGSETINVSFLKPGVYVLQVNTVKGRVNKKIIKE